MKKAIIITSIIVAVIGIYLLGAGFTYSYIEIVCQHPHIQYDPVTGAPSIDHSNHAMAGIFWPFTLPIIYGNELGTKKGELEKSR